MGTPSRGSGAFFGTDQGSNLGGIHDPQLDKLMAGISTAESSDVQDQMLGQFRWLTTDTAYATVLAHSAGGLVLSPAYKDFQSSGSLHHVTPWLTPSA